MRLENYLLKIAFPDKGRKKNEHIYLHGVNSIFKEIYLEIKSKVKQNEFTKLIYSKLDTPKGTVDSWLAGHNPIPILKFYNILKLWKEICNKTDEEANEKWDKIFQKANGFSAWASPKVTLPKELNEEIAYLCGFIAGDGHIKDEFNLKRRGKNAEYSISVYDSSKKFIDFLTFLFVKNFKANTNCHYTKKGNLFTLRCTSKPIYRFFTQVIKMQCGRDTGNIRIPQLIKNSSKEIKLAFIRGFFDAEGSVGITEKNPWLEIAQISNFKGPPYILRWIKGILKENNVNLNGPQLMSCNKKAWRLRTSSKKVISQFYTSVSSWHPEKALKIDEISG
jgi:intein/homing endonuclease